MEIVLPNSSNWYVEVKSSSVFAIPSAPYVFLTVVLYFVRSNVIFWPAVPSLPYSWIADTFLPDAVLVYSNTTLYPSISVIDFNALSLSYVSFIWLPSGLLIWYKRPLLSLNSVFLPAGSTVYLIYLVSLPAVCWSNIFLLLPSVTEFIVVPSEA